MKSQTMAEDISALLRARNPLLWIVTREEGRAERYIMEAAASAGYVSRTWDVAQGIATAEGRPVQNIGGADPGETLAAIRDRAAPDNAQRIVLGRSRNRLNSNRGTDMTDKYTPTRLELDAIAERLKAHAVAIGLTDEYHARVTWANESTSVYLTMPCRKIRVGDHGAAYGCDISVDPDGLTECEAIAWLNQERADEIESEGDSQ